MIPCVTNTGKTPLYYTKPGYSGISNKTFALHATSGIGTTYEYLWVNIGELFLNQSGKWNLQNWTQQRPNNTMYWWSASIVIHLHKAQQHYGYVEPLFSEIKFWNP